MVPIPLGELSAALPRRHRLGSDEPGALHDAAHNKYRSEIGLPPLFWSGALAASAQQWAEQLATMNRMQHSGAIGRGREPRDVDVRQSVSRRIGRFVGRRRSTISCTPACSRRSPRTGEWHSVDHYTQIIWKETAQMGCGLATGGGNDFLVCQYQPKGNMFSEKVY